MRIDREEYIERKYAISPYYINGFVDVNGNDLPYLICDRKGSAVTEKLINHVPVK